MAIHWEKLALAVAGGVGGVGGKRDPAARRHRSFLYGANHHSSLIGDLLEGLRRMRRFIVEIKIILFTSKPWLSRDRKVPVGGVYSAMASNSLRVKQ
jgi:hypothetical protein